MSRYMTSAEYEEMQEAVSNHAEMTELPGEDICLTCPLDECVGAMSVRCPLNGAPQQRSVKARWLGGPRTPDPPPGWMTIKMAVDKYDVSYYQVIRRLKNETLKGDRDKYNSWLVCEKSAERILSTLD